VPSRFEPGDQRRPRLVEDRPCSGSALVAAHWANHAPSALAPWFVLCIAIWAGKSVRPPQCLKIGKAGPHLKPDRLVPSLHPHYQVSPLLRTSPPRRLASVRSPSGCSSGLLPWHRDARFPRSSQEPGHGSRHLYAGHRPDRKQVPSGLDPRTYIPEPGFDDGFSFSTPHQWLTHVRLPSPCLTGVPPPFPDPLTTQEVAPAQRPAV